MSDTYMQVADEALDLVAKSVVRGYPCEVDKIHFNLLCDRFDELKKARYVVPRSERRGDYVNVYTFDNEGVPYLLRFIATGGASGGSEPALRTFEVAYQYDSMPEDEVLTRQFLRHDFTEAWEHVEELGADRIIYLKELK